MHLQVNWKQIVLKGSTQKHNAYKGAIKKEEELHQSVSHQLVSRLKFRDSICKRIKIENSKLKIKLQEQMRNKRNKSEAIQAAKIQRENEYQLHSRYFKQSEDLAKRAQIVKRSKSLIDQDMISQHNSLSKDGHKTRPIKFTQAIKIDKSFQKEVQGQSINMQKLYDSCANKISRSAFGSKQKVHDIPHSKTEQNQLVSSALNQCVSSSDHKYKGKPDRESIRIYLGDRNSSCQKQKCQDKISKKKRSKYSFFKQEELEVKGEIKKFSQSKKGSLNKLIKKTRQVDDESQYSNLLRVSIQGMI